MAVAAFALALSPLFCHAQEEGDNDDTAARRQFRIAEAHFKNGQFAEAARGFTEAYRLSSRPALLYNMYIAYRDADDLPHARDSLAEFLERNPDDPRSDQLRARLARLVERFGPPRPIEEIGTEAALEEPAVEQGSASAADEPQDQGVVGTRPPGHATDTSIGDEKTTQAGASAEGRGVTVPTLLLLGGGAALLVGSAVTGLLALGAESELEDKCDGTRCPSSLESTRNEGETLALASDVLLVAGLGAAAAGGILFFMDREDADPEPSVRAAVGCGSRGCAGSLTVDF